MALRKRGRFSLGLATDAQDDPSLICGGLTGCKLSPSRVVRSADQSLVDARSARCQSLRACSVIGPVHAVRQEVGKTVPEVSSPALPAAALADFVRRYDPELRRYLRSRLHREEDASDMAQECYARLVRYRDAHPEATLETGLLFRIANNLLTDNWRRNQLHPAGQDANCDQEELVCHGPTPEQIAEEQQILARLKRVVLSLPPKCQEVFVCSRWLGMSNAEVALRLGISVKAVEKQITKALAACREEVGDSAVERYS